MVERPGFLSFQVKGKNSAVFKDEAGGHRWQRVPPTEKKGRVQTSTITVAVLIEPTTVEIVLDERDLTWDEFRGSGKGGQKRNVTNSAVRITHIPSGLAVRVESERSQPQNKEAARTLLRAKLFAIKNEEQTASYNEKRKQQVGSGMRGDKIRTIRQQDNLVRCHLTDKKTSYKKYSRGDWDDLK